PKASGYRACHVILRIPSDQGEPVFAEIQVKTRLQDAWGELTHEDMYKPGAAMKPSKLHGEFARAMANMLATVDDMADTLAVELTALTDREPEPGLDELREQRIGIEVRVRATGPKDALAVDGSGRQGLIPAFAIRRLSQTKGTIKVNDYIHLDDRLRVSVEADSKGRYYIPLELPRHCTGHCPDPQSASRFRTQPDTPTADTGASAPVGRPAATTWSRAAMRLAREARTSA